MILSKDLKYNTVHSMVVGAVKYHQSRVQGTVGGSWERIRATSLHPTSSLTLLYYALCVILTISASLSLEIRTQDIVSSFRDAQSRVLGPSGKPFIRDQPCPRR